MTTISIAALTSYVVIGNQSGSPCSSYTTIDDPSRNVNYTGALWPCDNLPLFNTSNGGCAWIRFVGSGGELLASNSPDRFRCGAYMPIWTNGTLPTIIGTRGNLIIIFSTPIMDLYLPNVPTGNVMYCPGNFYIYCLIPPVLCNARFCTE